jgi:hypothetical protein
MVLLRRDVPKVFDGIVRGVVIKMVNNKTGRSGTNKRQRYQDVDRNDGLDAICADKLNAAIAIASMAWSESVPFGAEHIASSRDRVPAFITWDVAPHSAHSHIPAINSTTQNAPAHQTDDQAIANSSHASRMVTPALPPWR